jgi:hypothetical protein
MIPYMSLLGWHGIHFIDKENIKRTSKNIKASYQLRMYLKISTIKKLPIKIYINKNVTKILL